MSRNAHEQAFVVGSVDTSAGTMPKVSPFLKWADHWGTFKARWGLGRMRYRVEPGLYAIGNPDQRSPVLVSANYKMSFDRLREVLRGRDAWMLVLDTKGINVWCAAGKGTFGTEEIVRRIESTGLKDVVSHRELIVPQLGAPGVAAHLVKKLSGFKVTYGPIKSTDLPAFLDSGYRAVPEMRRKTFTVWERTVLIPVELAMALKYVAIALPAFFFLGGLGGPGGFWANALNYGLFAMVALIGSLVAGAVLAPLLLPYLPGRAFSLKGVWTGLLVAVILLAFRAKALSGVSGGLEAAAWLALIPALSAYIAMNFTGASTFTSLSGVKKEMRWAVPLEVAGGIAGLCLWLTSRLIA